MLLVQAILVTLVYVDRHFLSVQAVSMPSATMCRACEVHCVRETNFFERLCRTRRSVKLQVFVGFPVQTNAIDACEVTFELTCCHCSCSLQ